MYCAGLTFFFFILPIYNLNLSILGPAANNKIVQRLGIDKKGHTAHAPNIQSNYQKWKVRLLELKFLDILVYGYY